MIKLLPLPRSLTRRAGVLDAERGVTITLDTSLPAQGYRLSVSESGASIIAADAAGAFYGKCTLAQLVDAQSGTVPCVDIEDHPDLLVRGVMLDISRDKVPTMATELRTQAPWRVTPRGGCSVKQRTLSSMTSFVSSSRCGRCAIARAG